MSILVAILLGEMQVRLTKEYVTPEIIKERSLQYAPSLFARHVFPLKKQIIEKRGWVINSNGYRGDDFTQTKNDNAIRVIVYGGSAVFDVKAPNGKDWPSRLGHLLNENAVTDIEVINAGIPGHASFDSFGRLFSEGHIFEPDYVILYNAWNDIKYFSSEKSLLRKFKPYVESSDYRKIYQGALDQMFCEISQLYVHLRARYYSWKYHVGSEGIIQSSEYSNEVSELGLRQYKLNVEMFVDLALNINAIPILVTQPRLVAGDNTEEDKSKIRYDFQNMNPEELVKAYKKTDEIMISVAKTKNIPVITDASKQMNGKGEYFADHVHLNAAGSNRLSMIISEQLFQLIKSRNLDPSSTKVIISERVQTKTILY
jgi:lysophospholipase L1-like esterase